MAYVAREGTRFARDTRQASARLDGESCEDLVQRDQVAQWAASVVGASTSSLQPVLGADEPSWWVVAWKYG